MVVSDFDSLPSDFRLFPAENSVLANAMTICAGTGGIFRVMDSTRVWAADTRDTSRAKAEYRFDRCYARRRSASFCFGANVFHVRIPIHRQHHEPRLKNA